MENKKINIQEILKNKNEGTKLYSPLCGDVYLVNAEYMNDKFDDRFPIVVRKSGIGDFKISFTAQGTFFLGAGECMLFPSEKMHDWKKFAWKPGDILFNHNDKLVMFDGWTDDDYTKFNTSHSVEYENNQAIDVYEGCIYPSEMYDKGDDVDRADFIADLEKHYDGHFNPNTLKIEKKQIVEQQPILSNSSNIGKNCNLKVFQKVLGRSFNNSVWKADFFRNYSAEKEYPYECLGCIYKQCIPYEGNEHLAGTKKAPQ